MAGRRRLGDRNVPERYEAGSVTKMREYIVVLERGETNWGAYASGLPGLGVVAETPEEAERLIREGIEIYLDELRVKGERLPEPSAQMRHVQVAA
jgi:predicted RNase H-like HicB family nuclease